MSDFNLNSNNCGVPMSRDRFFLLGKHRRYSKSGFKKPTTKLRLKPLEDIVDFKEKGNVVPDDRVRIRNLTNGMTTNVSYHKQNLLLKVWLLDIYSSPSRGTPVTFRILPCLASARGYAGGFSITNLVQNDED